MRIDVRIVRSIMRCLVRHGDALPITQTQRSGHLSEISCLLFLLSRSAPLLKRLSRRLNQPKKRPGRARIGRYLGLIEAHSRSAPVFLMAPRSTKSPGVGNPSSLKKFAKIDQRVDHLARRRAELVIGAGLCADPLALFDRGRRSKLRSNFRDAGSPCPSPCGPRALLERPRSAPMGRCDRHATRSCLPPSTSPAFPDWRGSSPD